MEPRTRFVSCYLGRTDMLNQWRLVFTPSRNESIREMLFLERYDQYFISIFHKKPSHQLTLWYDQNLPFYFSPFSPLTIISTTTGIRMVSLIVYWYHGCNFPLFNATERYVPRIDNRQSFAEIVSQLWDNHTTIGFLKLFILHLK